MDRCTQLLPTPRLSVSPSVHPEQAVREFRDILARMQPAFEPHAPERAKWATLHPDLLLMLLRTSLGDTACHVLLVTEFFKMLMETGLDTADPLAESLPSLSLGGHIATLFQLAHLAEDDVIDIPANNMPLWWQEGCERLTAVLTLIRTVLQGQWLNGNVYVCERREMRDELFRLLGGKSAMGYYALRIDPGTQKLCLTWYTLTHDRDGNEAIKFYDAEVHPYGPSLVISSKYRAIDGVQVKSISELVRALGLKRNILLLKHQPLADFEADAAHAQ
jgi:hypothetical protein